MRSSPPTLLFRPYHVCVGKEWYRFPSSFFLPDPEEWKLKFLKSEFRGQLPRPYKEVRNNDCLLLKTLLFLWL